MFKKVKYVTDDKNLNVYKYSKKEKVFDISIIIFNGVLFFLFIVSIIFLQYSLEILPGKVFLFIMFIIGVYFTATQILDFTKEFFRKKYVHKLNGERLYKKLVKKTYNTKTSYKSRY
jgi:hypothetical protein